MELGKASYFAVKSIKLKIESLFQEAFKLITLK